MLEVKNQSKRNLLLTPTIYNKVDLLSQKKYNKSDMKTDLKRLILKIIRTKDLKSFSCFDFTDIAPYKTISKCLERLEDEEEIIRIIPGIYCVNKIDKTLKIKILPSVDNVVRTIARKNNWNICPTGNTAINAFGLSTQVVAAYTYLSNGPYKEYEIFENKVFLKRTMNREISGYSSITNLLIQCIKAIGENNITPEVIETLKAKLSTEDKKRIIKETKLIQAWIRKVILMTCEGLNYERTIKTQF